MKKYFLAIATTIILTISFLNAWAQKSINNTISGDIKNLTAYVLVADDSPAIGTDKSTLYRINFKAVSDFKNTYKNLSDETWEVKKDGYVARFVSNSVRTLNYYDKKGRWLHCIQCYDETKLPKDVRATVKMNYYDYSITSIQEINMKKTNLEPIYLVYLKYNYNNTFKTVRLFDGELEEVNL